MLSRFHRISERGGQTNGRTDRQTELLYQYRAAICWDSLRRSTNRLREERRSIIIVKMGEFRFICFKRMDAPGMGILKWQRI